MKRISRNKSSTILWNRKSTRTSMHRKLVLTWRTKYKIFPINRYNQPGKKHMQVFTKEFSKRFKKDIESMIHNAIPLSRDILEADNECLTQLMRKSDKQSTTSIRSKHQDRAICISVLQEMLAYYL